MIKQNMLYYKKKRNILLFFVYIPFIVGFSLFFILNSGYGIDINTITTYLLPFAIVYMILLLASRNKINYYNMQFKYYEMKHDSTGPLQIPHKIFTKKWLNDIIEDGYKLGTDAVKYQFYYRISRRLEGVGNRGEVLECIIIAKKRDFDFYGHDIDKEINQIHVMFNKKNNIKKIVVLQFKRFDKYDEDVELEIDKIINFSNQLHHIIHITIGYFSEYDQIYFLNPNKKFPNKYYYYACQQIKKHCGITEKVVK